MTTHAAFTLQRDEQIPELNGRARFYLHKQTGAQVLSISNDDENKVFGATFRTPPENSNGVAHIMEHSVLCGSRKYPVKEPFVELLKGSLYTFLNAMTYPDKTIYPVASTNRQDFYNLIDVYLDAVFFPRITPEILQQEGWHYELEKPGDPLSYKGVVFNEMKGAYSSPDRAIYQYSRQSLFPDTIYAVDSGGDPREIPGLTYDYFLNFHKTYYHPSNAFLFFYGDDDPAIRLKMLDEYLSQFHRKNVDVEIALQPRFDKPRAFTFPYIAPRDSNLSKKGIVTVNWLLSDQLDHIEDLRLGIFDHVLMGNPAAPLWKALIDSGLGEDLSMHGFSSSIRESYFSTGLRNIDLQDAGKVEKIIFDTLNDLVKSGIPKATVEAAMNTVEFRLRENNTGSTPRGLSVMLRALSLWLYGGDPIVPLGFEEPLRQIKDDLAKNPRMFEEMIERYFLKNSHRTTVVLEPDPQLAARDESLEKARLTRVQKEMSDADLKKVIEQTKRLHDLQTAPDAPEDLAKIPRLTLNDLEKFHKPIPIDVTRHGQTEILFHDLFTSGILYLTLGFDLRQIPRQLLPYTRLFGRAMLEMGTQKESFVELSERIGRDTGGISQSPLSYSRKDSKRAAAWLMFDGKTTVGQTAQLLSILKDILLLPNFSDKERFRQIVLDAKSGKESALANSGHSVVSTRLGACFTEAGWFNEEISGLNYLFFLRKLAEQIDTDWSAVQADLQAFHNALINQNAAICNITVDAANWQQIQPALNEFLNTLPARKPELEDWEIELSNGFEGISIPAKVNFVGKAANIYDSGYEFHGSALAANKLVRTGWLWNRVRVQGGAYGAFCSFNRRSGVLGFLSYRDPNLLETLQNFDQTSNFLRSADVNRDELTKSIIGVIGALDAYELPDEKGYTAMLRYLIGETDEEMQILREEVLSTSVEHFRQYADAVEYVKNNGIVAVAGSKEALAEANSRQGNFLKIMKVL